MKFKKIANLEVSALGFGCWAMGGTWNNIEDKASIETVHRAVDLGINGV